MSWWYLSVLDRILHVSKMLSHSSHQVVGESSRNSGSFTLDMSRVAIVERTSWVTNVEVGKLILVDGLRDARGLINLLSNVQYL